MISKSRLKFVVSLQKKKIRDEEHLFVIEGDKIVREFLEAGRHIKILIAKAEFLLSLPPGRRIFIDEIIDASFEELKQVSSLKTPHNAVAVINRPVPDLNINNLFKRLTLGLDFVQDPGNLGTIIRTASWFGINDIICSEDCVDVYNPKVIQASMGAILNVNVYYSNLRNILIKAREMKIPVFGAMLEGESIYNHKLGKTGMILLGNESSGISEELMPFISERISIPGANKSLPGIESLNVAMAASVILSEFFRRPGLYPSEK